MFYLILSVGLDMPSWIPGRSHPDTLHGRYDGRCDHIRDTGGQVGGHKMIYIAQALYKTALYCMKDVVIFICGYVKSYKTK